MTTVGRWSPNKVRGRVLDGTWVSPPEDLGGMVLITPTSIVSTGAGSSSSIGANGSVTFTSCATLSLNNVFSATYDNYLVRLRLVTSTGANIYGRLRSAGTDNSSSVYSRQYIDVDGAGVYGQRETATSQWNALAYSYNNRRAGSSMYFFGPYLTQPTAVRTVIVSDYNNAAMADLAGFHDNSSAFDGLTLYPTAGTFTGLVSVYGLKGA